MGHAGVSAWQALTEKRSLRWVSLLDGHFWNPRESTARASWRTWRRASSA